MPFTPEESGRFEFAATAEKLDGEVVDQNNQAARQVNIIDDYLRLMYVAYEPTWEWRFIKEVFHRDKLVGMQGFRTFLGSSDPRVRESNVLFLPTLTPKRSEFFANDVIFLDDMPRAGLTDRFCEMTKEYVGNFGGGLVVIAGPRFGPRELHQTPLADMLPVIVDPNAELRDAPEHPEFRLAPHAARGPLSSSCSSAPTTSKTRKAWDNLGKLPWYQPVAALHEQAFALAEHPTDKCADGKTPQPLIAVRQVRQGRSRLSRLQRDVAAAAAVRREVLPPVLVAAHLSPGHEPRPGRREAIRRPPRSAAVSGRGQGDAHRRGLRRELRAAGRREPARARPGRRS